MNVFTDKPKDYWGEKINFVDINNVFVGYELDISCCEHADWFFSQDADVEHTWDMECESKQSIGNIDKYVFDTTYFVESPVWDGDGGAKICFKLVADCEQDMYLHIFNAHNGYYGHGFEANINGIEWQQGIL
jgi:hypothetical protein